MILAQIIWTASTSSIEFPNCWFRLQQQVRENVKLPFIRGTVYSIATASSRLFSLKYFCTTAPMHVRYSLNFYDEIWKIVTFVFTSDVVIVKYVIAQRMQLTCMLLFIIWKVGKTTGSFIDSEQVPVQGCMYTVKNAGCRIKRSQLSKWSFQFKMKDRVNGVDQSRLWSAPGNRFIQTCTVVTCREHAM